MWNKLQIVRNEYINQRITYSIDYEKFCMISIVYNSSKIEGCSLTETDTKALLENNITALGKPLSDHLMVKGRAARLLGKWFLTEKLGKEFWKLSPEKLYKEHQTEYYTNINLRVNYYELNYNKCIPFLLILPKALENK